MFKWKAKLGLGLLLASGALLTSGCYDTIGSAFVVF